MRWAYSKQTGRSTGCRKLHQRGYAGICRIELATGATVIPTALSLYQGIDDQQGVLQSHINLAEVALSVRDYQASQRHLDQATDIIRTKPLSPYQQRIALLYALQALQQKHIVQAEHLLLSLLPVFHNATPVTIPDAIQMSAIANRTKIAFMNNQDEALWVLRYAKALEISAIKDYDLEARLLPFSIQSATTSRGLRRIRSQVAAGTFYL